MPTRRGVLVVGGAIVALILVVALLRIDRYEEESLPERQPDPFEPSPDQIVESAAPDPTAPAWRLAREPVMTVGVIRGDLDTELWHVLDAVLTETGRLVVINPMDEVRVFNERGQFLHSVGGKGEGPGNLNQAPQLAPLAGDSFAVWDRHLRRITTFDGSGKAVRTTNLAIDAICCFRDGAFLIRSGPRLRFRDRVLSAEVVDWSIAQAVEGPARPEPLFTLLGDDALIGVHTGGLMGGTAFFLPPFARSVRIRLTNDAIVYGRGDTYELRVYSREGDAVRVIRTPAVRPITAADREATRASFTARRDRDGRRAYNRAWNRLELPATMPAYGTILVEETGVIWARNYEPSHVFRVEPVQDRWDRANAETVRLMPGRFPELPAPIRDDLEARSCTIPQVSSELGVRQPHNVVMGDFLGLGRRAVAVLCSIRDTSRILVYAHDGHAPVDSLAKAADRLVLQGLGNGAAGYSRLVGAADTAYIRRLALYFNAPLPARLDHQGIEDAFVEKGSVIHYFDAGRWLRLQGID
jgi:hypothetical protein